MNEVVRRILAEIIVRHTRPPALDVRRCEGLLRDYLRGEYKKEINVLVSALREQVVADLLASGGSMPPEVLLKRCARKLHDQTGIAEDLARWSVESWALALGVIASDTDTVAEKTTTTVPIPSPISSQAKDHITDGRNRMAGVRRQKETPRSGIDGIEQQRLSDLLQATTTRGWQRIGDHWY